MSSVDFGVPDFCFPISEPLRRLRWHSNRQVNEQLLKEAAEALASGTGGCGLPLEPVLDVLPARWASGLCQLACHDLRNEW